MQKKYSTNWGLFCISADQGVVKQYLCLQLASSGIKWDQLKDIMMAFAERQVVGYLHAVGVTILTAGLWARLGLAVQWATQSSPSSIHGVSFVPRVPQCKSISHFTMGLKGSQCDYVALIAIQCASLIDSGQPSLGLGRETSSNVVQGM